jgi:hypothetical protein
MMSHSNTDSQGMALSCNTSGPDFLQFTYLLLVGVFLQLT